MEVKVTEKKDAPLLYRTELTAEIVSDKSTPSKEELKKKCASALNVSENLIVIKKIITLFGSKKSKAVLYQYKDEAKLKSIEPREKKKDGKKAEQKEEPAA